MNIRYKDIIWDWNGTLLDDAFACIYAMNILLREHGLPEVDKTRYMQVFGFPVKEYYKLLGFDFSKVVWDDLANHFISIYKDKTLEADLHSGTLETFELINDADIDMHILSASESKMLDHMIRKHKLDGLVKSVTGLDNIYASSKIGIAKRMLKSLVCDPSRCLMVGDTIHDVEVADALGIDCVLVEGGYQSRERLFSTGKPVFKNIKEVLTFISQ